MNRTEQRLMGGDLSASEGKAAFAAAMLQGMKAIGDAVRELGRVPSGNLYAAVMNTISLPAYERMIQTMVAAGLIREQGDLLVRVDVKEAR
jgi:hypothetical protein